MPFSSPLIRYPLVRRVLTLRQYPLVPFAVAFGLVVASTVFRWGIGSAIAGAPFLTYYPAIVLATLVGGLWPGVLATALSTGAALALFMTTMEPEQRILTTFIFILLSGINLIVVGLLHAAVRHVLEQEANLRILIESSPTGIVVVDDVGAIRLVNTSVESAFGYKREELLGKKIESLVPADRAHRHEALRSAYLVRPETRSMGEGLDRKGQRKDGSEFPVEIALNPVKSHGKASVLATIIDITDRVKASETQQLVVRELRHRTQNLFAVFQTLAAQSLTAGKSMDEARALLNGRLKALSDAYATLADSSWDGAMLSDLIRRQLAGFPDRVTIAGCDISIGPAAAQKFALVVHELATNAVKYGALSTPEGRVTISGMVAPADHSELLVFRWEEIGGPEVKVPRRKGFGSVILLDSIRDISRSIEREFRASGMIYEAQVELAAIRPHPAAPSIRHAV